MNDKLKIIFQKRMFWIALLIITIVIFAIMTKMQTETTPAPQSRKEVLDIVTIPKSESAPITPAQESKIINLMTPKAGESLSSPKAPPKVEKENIFKAMSL